MQRSGRNFKDFKISFGQSLGGRESVCMDNHYLNELTLAHLDGCISDSEFAELQQLLESDAAARSRYVELALA